MGMGMGMGFGLGLGLYIPHPWNKVLHLQIERSELQSLEVPTNY